MKRFSLADRCVGFAIYSAVAPRKALYRARCGSLKSHACDYIVDGHRAQNFADKWTNHVVNALYSTANCSLRCWSHFNDIYATFGYPKLLNRVTSENGVHAPIHFEQWRLTLRLSSTPSQRNFDFHHRWFLHACGTTNLYTKWHSLEELVILHKGVINPKKC